MFTRLCNVKIGDQCRQKSNDMAKAAETMMAITTAIRPDWQGIMTQECPFLYLQGDYETIMLSVLIVSFNRKF